MANTVISMEKIKDFFNSQVYDEDKWALNIHLIAKHRMHNTKRKLRKVFLILFDNEWMSNG
ncbi:hypothetical protein LguiB_007979 [Lonicera macranthoides]